MKRLFLIITALAFCFSGLVFAQNKPTSGITVSPSITRLDLAYEKPELIIKYKNTTDATVELSFSAQDFTELEEGWQVKFLEPANAKNYRYSLSSWIQFEKKSLILKPNEEKSLRVYISASRLSPGGHYGSIQAEIQQNTGQGQVGLRQILSSLLFVRTATGKEIEKAEVKEFSPIQNNVFQYPKQFVFRFNNSGNTELVPHGIIEVKDPLNRLVAKGIVNEESLITLPESRRRYDVNTRVLTKLLLPGQYSALLTVNYGKDRQELVAKNGFWVFNYEYLATAVISFGVIFMFLRHRR